MPIAKRKRNDGPPSKSSVRRNALRDAPLPPGDDAGVAQLAARVATNLREHRRRRDLSLDQLSQVTGVSRAGLSQIETLKTNPSIGVLWKIASGLGIPFSELIGDGNDAMTVVRRQDTQVLRSADRKFESRPLMPAGGANQVEVYELRLAPRARHVSEAHGPGTRELVIVLAGTLRMVVADRVENLGPGDSVLFNASVPHTYENPSGAEVRCFDMIIYSLRS